MTKDWDHPRPPGSARCACPVCGGMRVITRQEVERAVATAARTRSAVTVVRSSSGDERIHYGGPAGLRLYGKIVASDRIVCVLKPRVDLSKG